MQPEHRVLPTVFLFAGMVACTQEKTTHESPRQASSNVAPPTAAVTNSGADAESPVPSALREFLTVRTSVERIRPARELAVAGTRYLQYAARLLKDSDEGNRRIAIWVLGSSGDRSGLLALDAHQDQDPQTHRIAKAAAAHLRVCDARADKTHLSVDVRMYPRPSRAVGQAGTLLAAGTEVRLRGRVVSESDEDDGHEGDQCYFVVELAGGTIAYLPMSTDDYPLFFCDRIRHGSLEADRSSDSTGGAGRTGRRESCAGPATGRGV